MKNNYIPDLEEAKKFLESICGKPPYCFQTFDDSKKKVPKLSRVLFGTLEEHAEELTKLSNEGAGVFVSINTQSGPKRGTDYVTKVNAVFADQDNQNVQPPDLGIDPFMIVESSPGKFHYYWRIKNCPLDRFKPAQKRIAQLCSSDPVVCDLSRVMRLPGFPHQKDKPFMTRIVDVREGDCQTIDFAQMADLISLGQDCYGISPSDSKDTQFGPDIPEGKRHIYFIKLASRFKDEGVAHKDILKELLRVNSQFTNPTDIDELEDIYEHAASWSEHLDVTQIRVAERAVSIYKDVCRSIPSIGLLRKWDGKCWKVDHEEFCMDLLTVSRQMIIEELNKSDTKKADANIKKLRRLEEIGKLRAIRDAYCLHPEVIDSSDDYDRDLYLLNTQDGIVDIRTGKIKPHDPNLKITKITPFGYGGDCDVWTNFQDELALGDKELISFRQKVYGLGTLGENPPQKMFIEQGPTATGKTTLQEVIKAVLGPYAKTLPVTLISGSRSKSDAPSPSFADLDGVRAVFISEFDEDSTGNASALKLLNSEETVSARQLYRGNQEIKIRSTIYAATNFLPKFAHDDPALKRRIQIIPSTETVTEENQNPDLQKQLVAEGPGILAWMVMGFQKFLSDGLQAPDSVQRATAIYWNKMDVLRHWYEDRCNFDPKYKTTTRELYENYIDWCREAGIGLNKQLSGPEFSRNLARNPRLVKTRIGDQRLRGWAGITVDIPY